MNALPPFFDLSVAGSMAASLALSSASEGAAPPPPFAAAPDAPAAPCPARTPAPCRQAGWKRLAGVLFDLVSGPTL